MTNSTDKTAEIVWLLHKKQSVYLLVEKKSSAIHLPGSKVIQLSKGFETLDDARHYCKLDADLILPNNMRLLLSILKKINMEWRWICLYREKR
jgi:hypothetical protein